MQHNTVGTHYYERNIVDIKTEYTNFFMDITAPLIYEGIKSMHDKAIEYEQHVLRLMKENPRVKNPGLIEIFQQFLKSTQTWNSNIVETETVRIRDSSKHADIFDKLIKAVIKSHIVLLTYNASGKTCRLVNEKIHEKIDVKNLIHKIYIECSRRFYIYPNLFDRGHDQIILKQNQDEAIGIIKESIRDAIMKMLPLNDILSEYLKND